MLLSATRFSICTGMFIVWALHGVFPQPAFAKVSKTGRPIPRSSAIQPSGEAPRDGMILATWSSATKQAFGTSYEEYDASLKYSALSPTAPISHVWFTAAQGVLTEVFWPTVDTPQVRDSQILISDGKGLFAEERHNMTSEAVWLKPGVPAFKITNRDPQNRFTIEKILYTDPDLDSVIQHVRITRTIPGLKFYILHNAHVGNTPMGNSGFASTGKAPGPGLYAWQDQQAQALLFSIPLKQVSSSFSGAYDGFQDLANHFQMTYRYEYSNVGNVVLTGQLDLPDQVGSDQFNMVLGFGTDIQSAWKTASTTLAKDLGEVLEQYTDQWLGYQSKVKDLSNDSLDQGKLYRASVAVLKSMEDKTYEGAYVASPTNPWGEHTTASAVNANDRSKTNGGYHLVWPRDLFQMATAMMAIEDYSSATAALNRMKAAQLTAKDGEWYAGFRRRSKDGSFPQNFWVNGETFSGGLQLDEVAMPVILAYRLWKEGKINPADYWNMVSRAADFIQGFGPWTWQERWEEIFGASPSTIAAEIAALWVASEFAHTMGDPAREQLYQTTADQWSSKPGDNIETWAFTQNGTQGNGKYFLRSVGSAYFEEVWNPNGEEQYYLPNNGGLRPERDIVDGGFLELVRFGVRKPVDYSIISTLPVYDQTIRVNVPGKGPGFRRYVGDRYNYDETTGQQTDGMLWPLLTGERGHYELARAAFSHQSPLEIFSAVNPYISAIEKFATAQSMIPEQVWDFGARAGSPTGCATPLGWSHGEYIKLLRSKHDHLVFDRIDSVAQRTERAPH